MARYLVTRDDITGEIDAAEVTFAFRGEVYKIDLTEEGENELGRALALYIANGRVAGKLSISGTEKRAPQPVLRQRGEPENPDLGRHSPEEIESCRQFCEENGIKLSSAQGRIPVIIWTAWRTKDASIVPEHLMVAEPSARQLKMDEASLAS